MTESEAILINEFMAYMIERSTLREDDEATTNGMALLAMEVVRFMFLDLVEFHPSEEREH